MFLNYLDKETKQNNHFAIKKQNWTFKWLQQQLCKGEEREKKDTGSGRTRAENSDKLSDKKQHYGYIEAWS